MLNNVSKSFADELRNVLDKDFLKLNASGVNYKTASCTDFSQHCYFNRQKSEIVSMVFQHANHANDNFEFLINQIGGSIRKVSVIFQKNLSRILQSDLF